MVEVRNSVREKLAAGGVVASITARLVRGVEIAAIARAAGFDTLYVDLEHSSFSLETTSQICIAALAEGIAPFVRVPAIAPEYIARVLRIVQQENEAAVLADEPASEDVAAEVARPAAA